MTALYLALCLTLVSGLAGQALAERSVAELSQQLAAGDRPESDRARDSGRKPAEVVAFLGIERGMTVIDLIAAGGYYTEVLSVAVGPEGRVYAQNSEYVLKLRDGANQKQMSARLAGGRLANVERLDRELSDLGLAPGSVDAAFTALNFHDIYNSGGPETAAGFLAMVHGLLKPAGVLGLIDHDGDPALDNAVLHRVPLASVREAVAAAGFEIAAEGTMLRNPADDHTRGVFDPSIRGQTDRFVLLLRKAPARSPGGE